MNRMVAEAYPMVDNHHPMVVVGNPMMVVGNPLVADMRSVVVLGNLGLAEDMHLKLGIVEVYWQIC